MKKTLKTLLLLCILLTTSCADNLTEEPVFPFPGKDGSILLKNGMSLTPAGTSIEIEGRPATAAMSPDRKYYAVFTENPDGYRLSVYETEGFNAVSLNELAEPLSGLCFDNSGNRLYTLAGNKGIILLYSFSGGRIEPENEIKISLEAAEEHFFAGLAVSGDDQHLATADIKSKELIIIDLDNGSVINNFSLTEPVSSVAFSPDGGSIFASVPHENAVIQIDIETGSVIRTIDVSLVKEGPPGAFPMSIAISSDGRALYCANAGYNSIAVVDINSDPGRITGHIPTDYFPISVIESGDRLLIASAGTNHTGKITSVEISGEPQFDDTTEQVHINNRTGAVEENIKFGIGVKYPRAVPEKTGEPSLIKNVFFIILKKSITGDRTGSNFSKLASEYTLIDNYYPVGNSAQNGMMWKTAGASGDMYLSRFMKSFKTDIPFPGNDDPNLAHIRFLWDEAADKGVTCNMYRIPGHTFSELLETVTGNSPSQLNLVYLTENSKDADRELGRIIETVSSAGIWETTAVFVTENHMDDPGNSRSSALVISPFAKKGYIEDDLYNCLDILRTIELMLGLEPLTHFDAAAKPLSPVFHENPVFSPYKAVNK